jgi:drug/metabolite transporter (DMT)-like permease
MRLNHPNKPFTTQEESQQEQAVPESNVASKVPPIWQTLLAFSIIYFVWGSTFLAIRVGVHEFPPFLMAALRFTVAGLVLCGWTIARGEPMPTRLQLRSILIIALLIFVLDYGILFWAEQRVASGTAAVVLATIPAFMAVAEILILGTQKLTLRLAFALILGLCGVAVLVSNSLHLGGAPVDRTGAIALTFAAITWAIGSALTRKLPLPASKSLSSGAQMLTGGFMLFFVSCAADEFRHFHPTRISSAAWIALLYLIVAGSILGFTAYIWLIHHQSPTRVGTYAYVNPVVAVILGYFFAGEALGLRTILGTVCVLIGVIVITTTPKKIEAPASNTKS